MPTSILQRLSLGLAALLLCIGASFAVAQDAHAQEHRIGIGAMFGSPTGVTFQYGLNEKMHLDVAIGGGFFRGGHFYSHVQMLWKLPLVNVEAGTLTLNIGGGIQAAAHMHGRHLVVRSGRSWGNDAWLGRRWGRTDGWFGVRVPVGVGWKFSKIPLDIFMEFGPGMYFVRTPDFVFTWSTGARYWF